jgi:hypothetical protein
VTLLCLNTPIAQIIRGQERRDEASTGQSREMVANEERRMVSPLAVPYPQKEGQKRAKNDKKNNPVSNLLV